MRPLVSVVIPTYNRKVLTLRAVESVCKQTYSPVEVLLIDDCSSDGTAEEFAGRRFSIPITLLTSKCNGGPAVARNRGILGARGKYVAFLDSDDVWLPEKLEHQVALLEASVNPERLLIYSQVWIQRRHEALVRPLRAKQSHEAVADYLFANGGYLDQNSILLCTSTARRFLYTNSLRLHEDWDLYLRLEQEGIVFKMVPAPLSVTFDLTPIGRASSAQPMKSLALLESWRHRLSSMAYFGLQARIAPQLRNEAPLLALRLIMTAYSKGAVSPAYALALVARLAHPELREVAYYVRGRFSSTCKPKFIGDL